MVVRLLSFDEFLFISCGFPAREAGACLPGLTSGMGMVPPIDALGVSHGQRTRPPHASRHPFKEQQNDADGKSQAA